MSTLTLLAALALQDVPNPEYAGWSGFKTGSWVTMRSEIINGTVIVPVPAETTVTLVEFDERKAVVEQVETPTVEGKPAPGKPKKRTYKATLSKPPAVEADGEEELEIAGRKLKCRRTLLTPPAPGLPVRFWWSPEVPGGLVRMEFKLIAGNEGVTRVFATAWEKK